jgi:hypothetical protein
VNSDQTPAAPDQQTLWDEAAAQSYDTPGEGMFAPEVLGPTVQRLAELADGGSAVEFAIGTGRVASCRVRCSHGCGRRSPSRSSR